MTLNIKKRSAYDTRSKWASLQSIWERAFESPKDYPIKLNSIKEAQALRRELYSTIRRAEKPRTKNQELVNLAKSLAISLRGDSILIYKRQLSNLSKSIIEVAGEEPLSEKSSFDKLKSLLGTDPLEKEGKGEKPINPYFQRREE